MRHNRASAITPTSKDIASASTVGLLDQVQPQPMISKQNLAESSTLNMNGTNGSYMQQPMPTPLTARQPTYTYEGALVPHHSRPLPVAPGTNMSPFSENGSSYFDTRNDFEQLYFGGVYDSKAAPPIHHMMQNSFGYMPIPEPPAPPKSVDYDCATHRIVDHYSNAQSPSRPYRPSLRRNPSTYSRCSRNSQTSQSSRIESIGAGDRRHSRRLPEPPKMSTAERIRALRAATADVMPAPTALESDMGVMQYPVRENYRYQNHYGYPYAQNQDNWRNEQWNYPSYGGY